MTLHPITSDLLKATPHGFFTRLGGVSDGIHQGLNCGYGSDDTHFAVTQNRAKVAAYMDVAPQNLVTVHQYHSADVVTVTTPFHAPPKADAMVTNTAGIALGILTADCQPVLFHDPQTGVIGAAHAGWKGAIAGVLENTVEAMLALGAKRDSIHATIGPCISQTAYEVGPDFRDAFMEKATDHGSFFTKGTGDRYLFDLPGFGLSRLKAAGIQHANWCQHCTLQDEERFFSYRRSTKTGTSDYGRLISVIRT
ncbi:MAG: peptidoglycan editing factor PgeF [Halocynthiibacter sp.]